MDNLSQTDVVLSKCRFILHNFRRDAWRNLWLSGDTGNLTVNKVALPIEVSAEMVSYSYFYWKKYDCNWVTKLRSRYYCNMPRIRPRLIRCHWSFDSYIRGASYIRDMTVLTLIRFVQCQLMPQSQDTVISKFGLENPSSRSCMWSKVKIT